MEDVKDMYETMLRVSNKVDMLYEAYEKQVARKTELKTLLQEEEEDNQWLQLKLQATIEVLEELKRNDQSLQIDHGVLREVAVTASATSHDRGIGGSQAQRRLIKALFT